MCNIKVSVSNSKTANSKWEKLLSMVRSYTGGEKCCERCGIVEWIENEGLKYDRQKD